MKTAQHWPVQKRRPSQAKKVAAMLVAVVAGAGAIVVKTHQKVPIQYKQLKRPLLQTFRHKLNAALRPHAVFQPRPEHSRALADSHVV